ncbi:MAG: hypothetical protein R3F59_36760 [Myxococcota bacterium]
MPTTLALALLACSGPEGAPQHVVSPPEPAPEGLAPRPAEVPVALRVRSAGVAGEYPVPHEDPPDLTLWLVDGDPATAWHPRGIARIEVAPAVLTSIELAQQGVQALRWRGLFAEADVLRPGAWRDVDLSHTAAVGEGPWQRFTAHAEQEVRGIELEVTQTDGPEAAIAELRLVGNPDAPDDGVRGTRYTAVASTTADGPFQRQPEQVDALDPARCAIWIDGAEQRGTENTCEVGEGWFYLGIPREGAPRSKRRGAGGDPTEADDAEWRRFLLDDVGGCFALVDGFPYTRCAPPAG